MAIGYQIWLYLSLVLGSLTFLFYQKMKTKINKPSSSSDISSSSSSSSSSSEEEEKYDVFLSFRGKDTRFGFTSSLNKAFCEKNIKTYMDDQNLESGRKISPTLMKAIQESKICIIVLSKNFASSTWCLDELVEILKCKRNENVIPIFYDIDPYIVRKQKDSYAEAFAKHEQCFRDQMEKVQQWRGALKKVANLSGYDSKKWRAEYELVDKIAEDILLKLPKYQLTNGGHLIGIEEPMEKIESLLSIGSMDVRIIGIWGMGGIGKTTLASIVFQRCSYSHFDGYCFLKDIPEGADNTHHLRRELLFKLLNEKNLLCTDTPVVGSKFIQDRFRCKKVFIVLDNLNGGRSKLQDLFEGYRFANGSRIIVTSRDKQLLKTMADAIYELKGLYHGDALKLFRFHAFGPNSLATGYEGLLESVARYAKGNPLALKVLGSSLKSKSIKEWESALDKLKTDPDPDIQKVLRISFDGLGDKGIQGIFLDMACFFTDILFREEVESILNRPNHSDATYGISVLIDKSLLIARRAHVSVEMHDLVRQMGRAIVCDESNVIGNRSRLWNVNDVRHVLEKNTGTSAVEGIFLDMGRLTKAVKVSPTAFSKMFNLRFLKMFSYGRPANRCLPDGLECFVSDEIRYFHWAFYPLKYLPYFSTENLVRLIMNHSQLELLWKEDQPLELVKLKRIDLEDSKHLIRIPNLSRATNLEDIDLGRCTSLVEAPSFFQEDGIENLPLKLRYLYLNGTAIKSFAVSIGKLKYLTLLDFSECSNLSEIEFNGTKIEEFNGTEIEDLNGTEIGARLNLSRCKRLEVLPENIWKLKFVKRLTLSYCPKLGKLPEISGHVKNLKWIDLKGTGIEELPESIGNLVYLTVLDLSYCKRLKVLPESISKLKYLESLDLSYCPNLGKLPEFSDLMEHLFKIKLKRTGIEELPESIENLTGLKYLDLGGLQKIKFLPNSLGKLSSLKRLNLEECSSLEELPPLPHGLKVLDIRNCERLKSIAELPSSLHKLYENDCTSLETISSWGSATERYFYDKDCMKLDDNTRNNAIADPVHLQTLSRYNRVMIEYPGDEIPKWFRYQSDGGNSINIRLPPNWLELRYVIYFVLDDDDDDDHKDVDDDDDRIDNYDCYDTDDCRYGDDDYDDYRMHDDDDDDDYDDYRMVVDYKFNFKTNTSNSDDRLYKYRRYRRFEGPSNSAYVLIVRDLPSSFQRVYNHRKDGFDLLEVFGPNWSNVTEASFSILPMSRYGPKGYLSKGYVKKFGIQLLDKDGNEVPNVVKDFESTQ